MAGAGRSPLFFEGGHLDTKDTGDIAVAALIKALLRRGVSVSIPVGDNQRYDLITDRQGKLERVQVKSGWMEGGAVVFKTCSSYVHRGRGVKTYDDDVEWFGVYSPDLDKCYMIPISCLRGIGSSARLRIDAPKNGQTAGVRWAKDYAID